MNTIQKFQTNQDPFEIIKKAVNALVNFVKPTFGPGKNQILINNDMRSFLLDDGVKISQEYGSEDRMENAVIEIVKASSKKTQDRAGDGTTGAMILLQGIINEIPSIYDAKQITDELRKALVEAVAHLRSKTKKITTQKQLKEVAEVSSNDPNIADVVSQLVYKVGMDGAVSVDDTKNLETTFDLTEGMQFDRGFVHLDMMTDADNLQTVMKNLKIVAFDRKVGLKDVKPILQKLITRPAEERDILIIADDFDKDLTELLVENRYTGLFKAVAVRSPGFGNDKLEYLKDLVAICGGEIITEQMNSGLVEFGNMGGAKKVIITQSTTTIIGGNGDVKKRIEQLKNFKSDSGFDMQKVKDRIARLSGGVAVIKVGGLTEEEMESTKEKVDDAVNATRLAFKGGVVDGAGKELAKIKTSSKILNAALKMPFATLKENMGVSVIGATIKDPTEVLIAALESAVSISTLLISTRGILVKYRETQKHDTEI